MRMSPGRAADIKNKLNKLEMYWKLGLYKPMAHTLGEIERNNFFKNTVKNSERVKIGDIFESMCTSADDKKKLKVVAKSLQFPEVLLQE